LARSGNLHGAAGSKLQKTAVAILCHRTGRRIKPVSNNVQDPIAMASKAAHFPVLERADRLAGRVCASGAMAKDGDCGFSSFRASGSVTVSPPPKTLCLFAPRPATEGKIHASKKEGCLHSLLFCKSTCHSGNAAGHFAAPALL
jgi:hypothetical protein